ncbi:MAG TPA: phosphatidylserine decarboxylase [Micromonosporaceae bacterium]|nr:phosphatidylserine decarboxylase [Micromonosporaceae bacterium]
MTQPPAVPAGVPGQLPVGDRVARALTADLTRQRGPKTALIVGVEPESPVLTAALDALLPDDKSFLVGTAAPLRAHLTALGPWVADRVQVLDSVSEADPVDFVVVATPLHGSAEEVRAVLDDLGKRLDQGGLLSVSAPAALPGLPDAGAEELERQATLFGVGSDLVLRNRPPLRVHRLRFTPAELATTTRLAPAYRPSSVPVTRSMHIDSNGVAAAGIALGLAAFARVARPSSRLWLLPALAAAPVAAFFRDPERDIPDDETAVVAASDGVVLSVERLRDERFGDDELLRVAVFLSVLDVHVNRAPVAGKVVDFFVADGGFAAAMRPAAEHNVAAYTVLETVRGTVVVAQRTGLVARRIVHRAPVGALLAKGERFGLIRFGSRTDVYLPADRAQPAVAPGDRVLGGTTVIATWD